MKLIFIVLLGLNFISYCVDYFLIFFRLFVKDIVGFIVLEFIIIKREVLFVNN